MTWFALVIWRLFEDFNRKYGLGFIETDVKITEDISDIIFDFAKLDCSFDLFFTEFCD